MTTSTGDTDGNNPEIPSSDNIITTPNILDKLTSNDILSKQMNFTEKESKRRCVNNKWYQENRKN